MNSLFVAHKHYGSLLLLLILVAILVALFKGPNTKLQRIVAVLVDINLVVGIIAILQVGSRNVSWLHPIFALGAVGLLHASAKSEDKAKVVRCFSIALVLLVAAWSVNAAWGPSFFRDEKGQPILPIKSLSAESPAPVAK
jgi:cytochrome b561